MMENELDTGVELTASEDSFEGDPILVQYQTPQEQERWLRELEAARKERQVFDTRAMKTIERYSDVRGTDNANSSHYNLLFANIDTKLAALYARIPEPTVTRRYKDAEDDVGRVAANLLARNLSYELETGDFDSKFKSIIWDRLVPGIGIGWVRLEQDTGEAEQTISIDEFGNEVITDIEGSEVKDQLAAIDYVSWDDFSSAPCQVWTDCRWVSRRIPMNKAAIEARFGETAPAEVLADLSFSSKDSKTNDSSRLKPKNVVQSTVDVYEIWDKETGMIYWIAESATVPLDVRADTNQFDNFFPTPLPPLGRFTTSSTIAVSDYSLVQDLYRDLDNLQGRIAQLVQALQLRWVYDNNNTALKDLYSTTNALEGIGINDWATQMGEKGGLRGAIEFAPLEEIADTYQKCLAAQEKLKQQIWEIEAIPDFVRGETQRYDSAAATQQKGQFGTSRLGTYQREVAKYAEALVRLKAHLICKFYKPEIIAQRAGTMPRIDQQYVAQAIQVLKSDLMRSFRLEVSVDSIQLANWNIERGERTQLVQAVGAAMGQLMTAAQQNPAMAPLGMHLLKFAVSGYKGSEEIEGYLDAGLEQMMAMQAQTQGQPSKPTPAEIQAQSHMQRVQGDMQITQMQEQTKQQVAAMTAQMEQIKLAARERENELDAELKRAKLMLEAMKMQQTAHHNAINSAHVQALDVNGLGGV